MNPKDPQAEQLNLLWDCFHPFDKAKTLDKWRTLVQAREQEILTELLGELPEYRDNTTRESLSFVTPPLPEYDDHISVGFNAAIDQVVSVIQRKIGELNG